MTANIISEGETDCMEVNTHVKLGCERSLRSRADKGTEVQEDLSEVMLSEQGPNTQEESV